MEEDIVYLEEVIDLAKTPNVHLVIKEREIKALENLIKGYRELEERIISLTNLLCINDSDENYIPKSKIKEKIEEIQEQMRCEDNEKVLVWLYKQLKVLHELMKV